jgi:Tfp pilus assembly protein PilF
VLNRGTGLARGFDTYVDSFDPSRPHLSLTSLQRRGPEVARDATAWLATARHPYFLWVHFYDPHAPYDPPQPYAGRFAGRGYDGEIAFTDAQIGRVVEALRLSGRDGDTIVIVVADHGEGLGEHDELTHAVLIYQSTMRVPFIVAGPGLSAGRVVSARVGTTDVLPTALAMLGFDADRALPGRDVRPLMLGRTGASDPLYQESLFGRLNCHWATLRGWVRDDWKLITGAEPELYNLADDPGERRNLASAEPDRVRRMEGELQRALRVLAPGGDRAQPRAVTAEQEERLRSLGYTAGSGGGGALDDPRLPNPGTRVALYDRLQAAAAARGPALARAFDDVVEITRIDPDNPFAFGTLASMAYRHGSLPLAAQAFQRALELDPDRPGVRQNYGKLLRELGRYAESERELRLAVAASEDDLRSRVSLGETLIEMGKREEAAQLVDAVLARMPADPEALGAKGRLLAAEGRLPEALKYLEQATAGSDPEPFIELARAYLAVGDAAKATEAATTALRKNNGHPWAMAVLGAALVRSGQRASGLEHLNRALAVGPRRPIVWDSLGEGFESAGDASRAAFCRHQAATLRMARGAHRPT